MPGKMYHFVREHNQLASIKYIYGKNTFGLPKKYQSILIESKWQSKRTRKYSE